MFVKVDQTSWSKGQIWCYRKKGLIIRDTFVKYESQIPTHSKVMCNFKVFADKQTDQWTERAKTIYPQIFDDSGIK